MRKLWFKLLDTRFKAALDTVQRTGACLGDLAAAPAGASAFFRPLRSALKAAAADGIGRPASSAARAAAEDFAALAENFFSGLALHRTAPDAAVREALLALQRACAAAPGLVSFRGKERAFAEIHGLCAAGRKTLSLAGTAAASAPDDFPQNLKFSTIYSGLDAVFDAFERCAEALFKI